MKLQTALKILLLSCSSFATTSASEMDNTNRIMTVSEKAHLSENVLVSKEERHSQSLTRRNLQEVGFKPTKGNLIGILSKPTNDWIMTFDVMYLTPNHYGHSNVIHFTSTGSSSHKQHGDYWFTFIYSSDRRVMVYTSQSNNPGNYRVLMDGGKQVKFDLDRWYSFKFETNEEGNNINVWWDNKLRMTLKNSNRPTLDTVKVYASSTFHPAANVDIKDIIWKPRSAGDINLLGTSAPTSSPTSSPTSLIQGVGDGCKNTIEFSSAFVTDSGSMCDSCVFCEGSATNSIFNPFVKNECVDCGVADSECTGLKVVTTFRKEWPMTFFTLTSSDMSSETDPETLVLEASNDMTTWTQLYNSQLNFAGRKKEKDFLIDNNQSFKHYSLTFRRKTTSSTMNLGNYGLVQAYTKACTAKFHSLYTGENLVPYKSEPI